MNLVQLIERSINQRKLSSILTVANVALGMMLVCAILVGRREVDEKYRSQSRGFELVVGPTGSTLQLVLNAIYHVDQSQGLLPYAVLEQLREQPSLVLRCLAAGRRTRPRLGGLDRGLRVTLEIGRTAHDPPHSTSRAPDWTTVGDGRSTRGCRGCAHAGILRVPGHLPGPRRTPASRVLACTDRPRERPCSSSASRPPPTS